MVHSPLLSFLQLEAKSIEHCVIRETFFFASSPILCAFYNNEKNYFAYWY